MSELVSKLWVFVMGYILRLTVLLDMCPTSFSVTSFPDIEPSFIQNPTRAVISARGARD